MNYFFHILLHNIIPLSIMISIGVILHKLFQLDIKTLSRLNFYLFAPVIIFLMLYESDISVGILFEVLLFFFLFFISLLIVVEVVLRMRRYQGGMRSAMRNSVILYNSANYGIPLNQLVFAFNPFSLSIQIIILMMQNLIANTYGVYSVNAHKKNLKNSLKTIFSLPAIYVIPLAFLLRGFDISIPNPLYIPLEYIAQGFIATATITLGVQLGSMRWVIRLSDVVWSNILRLLISPLIGFLVVLAMGIDGIMAQALILSCAVPTSLTSVLLAVEFDNEPEFSSQAVFSTTIFSIFTVTLVIFFIQMYF